MFVILMSVTLIVLFGGHDAGKQPGADSVGEFASSQQKGSTGDRDSSVALGAAGNNLGLGTLDGNENTADDGNTVEVGDASGAWNTAGAGNTTGIGTTSDTSIGAAIGNEIPEGMYVQGYLDYADAPMTYGEKWQEGAVRYNGTAYKYNNYIKTYLFMGIDNDNPVSKAEDYVHGGQSDAMFLLIIDSKQKEIRVVALNRNTMTEIEVCDSNNRKVGNFTAQLCLQHAYGDGMNLSCVRTVNAVSYLLYNIPISGFLAMNMGGLAILNDAIGGVELVVGEDFTDPVRGTLLKAGDKVRLDGESAYSYIRYRNTEEFDSAGQRLKRNINYLGAMMNTFSSYVNGSSAKAMQVYEKIEPYVVTDIEFANMAEEILKYGIRSADIKTVEGETVQGKIFEEFYPEKNSLYGLIIDNFYVRLN